MQSEFVGLRSWVSTFQEMFAFEQRVCALETNVSCKVMIRLIFLGLSAFAAPMLRL